MHWFFLGATWIDVVAISSVIGVLTCSICLVPRHEMLLHQRLWLGLGGAIALMTIASGLMLVSRTLEFSGAPFSGLSDYLSLVVAKTQYGHIWQARMAAVALLWIGWLTGYVWKDQGRRLVGIVGFLAMLVVIFSRSATGHAGDKGIFRLHVWIDGLHVLSAGVWVGSLFALSLLVLPLLTKAGSADPGTAVVLYNRLSRLLGYVLALVVLTGIYNASQGLVGIQNLWDTTYGAILTVKVVLVLCMVLIGAHNRYVKIPALMQGLSNSGHLPRRGRFERIGGWVRGGDFRFEKVLARLSRAVQLEALIALAIILAAALLHHAMPPADFRSYGALP